MAAPPSLIFPRSLRSLSFLALLLAPVLAAAQNPPPPAPALGIFSDEALRLRFYYPLEMRAPAPPPSSVSDTGPAVASPPSATASAPQPAQATPAPAPTLHNIDRCLRPLLSLELPPEKAASHPASLGSLEPVPFPEKEQIHGTIRFFEVDLACAFPSGPAHKKRDTALHEVAGVITHIPQMRQLGSAIPYQLGRQPMLMVATAGRLEPQQRPVLMMDMVTDFQRHVLLWIIESNDLETFNALTKSAVQFENAPPLALFSSDVGLQGSAGLLNVPSR